MRFGGHETFPIREGWLHKGLKLLVEQPELLVDEFAADWLGVGRNMAKSIRHWLLATGLSRPGEKDGKKVIFEPTELGSLLHHRDPYFLEIGTWWTLHINLVNREAHAATWSWFFNTFALPRFERAVCLEGFRRHVELYVSRPPSPRTLQRDVSCLLSSYAKSVPAEPSDPEEGRECPMTELGLLRYFRGSGVYQLNQGLKDIPGEILGYCVSEFEVGSTDRTIELTFHEAARRPNSPGRVFALTSEALFELSRKIESDHPEKGISISGQAGERVLQVQARTSHEWLNAYYDSVDERSRHAA